MANLPSKAHAVQVCRSRDFLALKKILHRLHNDIGADYDGCSPEQLPRLQGKREMLAFLISDEFSEYVEQIYE